MAVTNSPSRANSVLLRVRKDMATADGSEKVYSLDESLRTIIHVVPAADTTFNIRISAMGDEAPASFTGFAKYSTTNLTEETLVPFEAGLTAIGVDVITGTCDVYVRQVA